MGETNIPAPKFIGNLIFVTKKRSYRRNSLFSKWVVGWGSSFYERDNLSFLLIRQSFYWIVGGDDGWREVCPTVVSDVFVGSGGE